MGTFASKVHIMTHCPASTHIRAQHNISSPLNLWHSPANCLLFLTVAGLLGQTTHCYQNSRHARLSHFKYLHPHLSHYPIHMEIQIPNYLYFNPIIIVLSLIALLNQIKVDPRTAKKASSIQNGYRKSGLTRRFLFPCAWEQQE